MITIFLGKIKKKYFNTFKNFVMSRRCFLFSSSAAMSQRFSIIFSLFILIFVLSKVDLIVASKLDDVQATTDKLSVTRENEQPSTIPSLSEAMPEKTKSKENSRTRREIKSFDDDFSSRRVRRQIPEDQTNQYFINIIVYADTSMSDNYGNELERYITLTMAKVARIFKHFTIGYPISFGSVKIEKTNEDFSDEHKYGFDKPFLNNFCQWQSTQRNNRNMQNNSYVPLLLTRNRLFPVSHKDKHAIGMANVSSICDTNLSCTGVQDGPYSTASVIAHEIGHLLGIEHDFDNNIYSCWTKDEDESLYLMSKVDKKQTFKWSNCSNEYLTQFLESGGGDCLLAKPREKFDETRYRHLGEQYSLNKTCEFAYGRRYYARELDDRDKCGIFKCYKNQELGYFEYRSLMVPDGTTCGDNKICYEGECISSNKLKPVNGGWSDYGDFSECSRTCGGGIKMKYRFCNNPTPMYGGQYCLGNKKYYEICASNRCPYEESQDFRESQCAEIKKKKLRSLGIQNINTNWESELAYEVPNKRCVLYCINDNDGIYRQQNQMIIDGTPCKNDNSHMCVQGVCKKYGCDYKLNSTAEFDICGVCNGNNSTCHKITKNFTVTLQPEVRSNYNYIYTIPAGSHHIDIKQYTTNPSPPRKNYIALKLAKNKNYILNGGLVVQSHSNIYESSGINIEYSVDNYASMRVNINELIAEDLIVEVLFPSELAVVTQTLIEYYFPNESKNDYHYIWTTGKWSYCNATCQGIQERDVQCQRIEDNLIAANSFCQMKQPKSFMKCNSNCILRWDIESESACSAKCGNGTKKINYNCVQDFLQGMSTVKKLIPIFCSHIKKPSEFKGCYTNCITANWKYSNWGDCNVTCGGGGVRTRSAQCIDNNTGQKLNDNMCSLKKVNLIESCGLNECPKWATGPWSPCSVTLGKGEEKRQVTCQIGSTIIDNSSCKGSKPVNRKICSKHSSIDPLKKNKINYYDIALKLIKKMDGAMNDLRNQRSNLIRIFKYDERLLLQQQNQQITNSFIQFQKYFENAHNHGANYKTCDNTIITTVHKGFKSANSNINNCFATLSKNLALKINEIDSAINRGRKKYNHTSNLKHNCSENNIAISIEYCNSEMASATESIEALETSAKAFQNYTTQSLKTKDSCYNEATESFSRLLKNAYKSFVSCQLL